MVGITFVPEILGQTDPVPSNTPIYNRLTRSAPAVTPSEKKCAVVPSGECLRAESPPDRMLATPWRRLCLAAFGLSLVVAVLRGSVGIATCK